MSLSARIVGSNPFEARMYVAFCVVLFLLSRVGSGFATGRSPFRGVLPIVCRNHSFGLILKWEQTRGPNPSMKVKEL
jgi:hypothetical protein